MSGTPREWPVTSAMPLAPCPVLLLALQNVLSEQLSIKYACVFVLTTEFRGTSVMRKVQLLRNSVIKSKICLEIPPHSLKSTLVIIGGTSLCSFKFLADASKMQESLKICMECS